MHSAATKLLRRPRTVPDLVTEKGVVDTISLVVAEKQQKPRLTKLLLNVTLHGSVGSLQVVMSPEATVEDLVSAAVKEYVKEGRRPFLRPVDPSCYDLHYSQFSLESKILLSPSQDKGISICVDRFSRVCHWIHEPGLNREEKLMELGSRNFFICPKKCGTTAFLDENDDGLPIASSSTCPHQVNLVAGGSCFEWLKLMNLFTWINFTLIYS